MELKQALIRTQVKIASVLEIKICSSNKIFFLFLSTFRLLHLAYEDLNEMNFFGYLNGVIRHEAIGKDIYLYLPFFVPS